MSLDFILYRLSISVVLLFSATVMAGESGGGDMGPKLTHQVIKVRIDHSAKALAGNATLNFSTMNPGEEIKLGFVITDSSIENVKINGVDTDNYRKQVPPHIPDDLAAQLDLTALEVTIPGKIAETGKFTVDIQWKDSDFYGTAINPEDNKPFSLGQITNDNAFSSHLYYYPFIEYGGTSADIFISTNLNNAYAISSGELISRDKSSSGFETFHYRTNRMSGALPYPFAVAAYEIIEKIASDGKTNLKIFYFPEDKEYAEQRMPIMEDVFSFYVDIFGEYPFESLSIVETRLVEGNIGLAAQSVVMLSDKVWFATPIDNTDYSLQNRGITVVADEINHQWNFYKVNSPNYLAEGISRYVDSLYLESLGGEEVLKQQLRQTREAYFNLIDKHGIEDKPITDPGVYPALYFIKGACILNMLRQTYGYNSFKVAMRHYFSKFDGQVTSIADFQEAFEHAIGEDLSWFFNQWYERAGWPNLEIMWQQTTSQDSSAYRLELSVEQKDGAHYRIDKFPVLVKYKNGESELKQISISDIKHQIVVLRIDQEVDSLEFDPDGWVLARVSQ